MKVGEFGQIGVLVSNPLRDQSITGAAITVLLKPDWMKITDYSKLGPLTISPRQVSTFTIVYEVVSPPPGGTEVVKYQASFTSAVGSPFTCELTSLDTFATMGTVCSHLNKNDRFVRTRRKDHTPPKTSIDYNGGAPYHASSATFISPSTWLDLSAIDPVTPGEENGHAMLTQYSIDESTQLQTYSQPFQLPEGRHVLTYESTDDSGNVETPNRLIFFVDGTPPIASLSPSGRFTIDSKGNYAVERDSKISIFASDPAVKGASSGVSRTYYFTDWGDHPVLYTTSPLFLGQC